MIGFPKEQKSEIERKRRKTETETVGERKGESGEVKRRKSEEERNVKH